MAVTALKNPLPSLAVGPPAVPAAVLELAGAADEELKGIISSFSYVHPATRMVHRLRDGGTDVMEAATRLQMDLTENKLAGDASDVGKTILMGLPEVPGTGYMPALVESFTAMTESYVLKPVWGHIFGEPKLTARLEDLKNIHVLAPRHFKPYAQAVVAANRAVEEEPDLLLLEGSGPALLRRDALEEALKTLNPGLWTSDVAVAEMLRYGGSPAGGALVDRFHNTPQVRLVETGVPASLLMVLWSG